MGRKREALVFTKILLKMNPPQAFLTSVLLALAFSLQAADLKLPSIFSDHMVLQRDKPVAVWGWAAPGEAVMVTFAGHSKTTVTDTNGHWSVLLDALPADKTPRELIVRGDTTISIKNVLVGEVWICSGQSNMDMRLSQVTNAKDEIAAATNMSAVRCFVVPRAGAALPQQDFLNARRWTEASPNTAGGYTAVGFFFARELSRTLDVPVGIVDSSMGGTQIERWIPSDGWEAVAELEELKRGEHDSTLFNGMIAPLVAYGIRGVAWYQGESNMRDGDIYYHKMRALIGGWRQAWNQGDFPFYFAQLTGFANGGAFGGSFETTPPEGNFGWSFPYLRETQVHVMQIPHTGMAVTMDIGRADKDQHASNKQDVGKRLALWALAKDYGQDVAYSGPVYRRHQVEGNTVRIFFDHAEPSLMVGIKDGLNPVKESPTGKLKWVAIAGEDKKWHWADAVIDGQTLLVSSEQVPRPVAVRYAFTMYVEGELLYNKAGLPASPFRTDQWPVSVLKK